MKKQLLYLILLLSTLCLTGFSLESPVLQEQSPNKEVAMTQYYFPAEDNPHEGTWLTWPHAHTNGEAYLKKLENIWLKMAYALHTGEKVHIIAYDKTEQARIETLLTENGLDMNRVDFVIAKSDDVWSRDTGPMFVFDEQDRLLIADFAFDGWGRKTPYQNDDKIPQAVAEQKRIPLVPIPDFVLEGGSVELDGSGTAMLCKSSVVSKNRNPGMSVAQAEQYLSQYLGATNFIWLEGVVGEDITDAHIDGTARFLDDKTILTISETDFLALYQGVIKSDYEALLSAKNAYGESYQIIKLPMTHDNVAGLDYKGSYLNYYVGNEVVLVPIYRDQNDTTAIEILAKLYHTRKIVPIDVTALYQYGGMLHCITQQQPIKY